MPDFLFIKIKIRKCDDYNSDKIFGIIKEGMQEPGVKPFGRILLKPNTVLAHPTVFPIASYIHAKECTLSVTEHVPLSFLTKPCNEVQNNAKKDLICFNGSDTSFSYSILSYDF